MILPDLLRPNLRLVLCGSAPSRTSKEANAYYAHPGNLFWPTLHQVGLTPVQLSPHEFPRLLDFGIGLTDVNKTEWGADSELSKEALDAPLLMQKIIHFQPQILAFDSKFAALAGLGLKKVEYGLQPLKIGQSIVFVLPSPSGRARRYFSQAHWQELADLMRQH